MPNVARTPGLPLGQRLSTALVGFMEATQTVAGHGTLQKGEIRIEQNGKQEKIRYGDCCSIGKFGGCSGGWAFGEGAHLSEWSDAPVTEWLAGSVQEVARQKCKNAKMQK